ncbi:MAG: hypothetical protein WAU13_06770 [Albidovulum sp.]
MSSCPTLASRRNLCLCATVFLLSHVAQVGHAESGLKQICEDTITQGIVWEGNKWSPAGFAKTTFVLESRQLEECFRFSSPSRLQGLADEAQFMNSDSIFGLFVNHTVECIGMTELGSSQVDTFACIRNERASDGRVAFDCKGLGWEMLFVTPDVGFHFSRITGATDPSLDEKPPMFVSAGECSSIK